MKKFILNVMIVMCLLTVMPATMYSAEANAADTVSNNPVEFPIVANATKDDVLHVVADEKGTIIAIGYKTLKITHDYGKRWVTRSLPSKEMYSVFYIKGKFYLNTSVVDQRDTIILSYISSNGDQWVPFKLPANNGQATTILKLQYLNGKYIILGRQFLWNNETLLFTSTDGVIWEQTATIPSKNIGLLTWNGSRYTALGLGYEFVELVKRAKGRNQFNADIHDPSVTVEMIVYTSNDLKGWTLQSGSYKKGVNYTFSGSPNYSVHEEEPVSNGKIHLYDDSGNTLTSTDGITFTMKRQQKLFPNNDYRSPIFKVGKQYMVFYHYWANSGILTKAVTSTDKVHWKTTKVDKAIEEMFVIQAGKMLVGYSFKEIAISSNGFDWKKVL